MISGMNGKTTQPQLVVEYNKVEKFKIDYLKINGDKTRKQMYSKAKDREAEILNLIQRNMNVEVIMLVAGVVALIVLGIVMAIVIAKINDEKINTLQIFLSITEQQIQKFSSKT